MDAMTRTWSPEFIDDVIAAMRARTRSEETRAPWPYEMLADRYPAEQVLALMDDLNGEDIADYGVSLRSSWVCDYEPDIEQRIAAFKASRSGAAAQINATPTAKQAAGMISWLRARLEDQLGRAENDLRRVEIDSQLRLLALHSQVQATTEFDQQIWPFRAKCVSESWNCYSDGEDLVQAPCLHVQLIARQFASTEGFPRLLQVTDVELLS